MIHIPHSAPTIGDGEIDAVARVMRSGHLAQGAEVEAFEAECAEILGWHFGVAVNSGMNALHLALGALGLGTDDFVVLPSYGCAALLTAVRLNESQPLLCDVGDDFNLDPETVPPGGVAAIVPHLFGAPARIPDGMTIVEDIAQSMGLDHGKHGPIAITSFYATKLLTTGEGGMVLTDDESLAESIRDRRDYDNRDDFLIRYNYKLTDLQAAMGRVQLKRLPEFIDRRKEIALRYEEAFRDLPIRLPDSSRHVFFRYVVSTPDRDGLERHLNEGGVEAKRPVYRPAHHYLGGDYPGADRAHDEGVSIPIYPLLSEEQAGVVIDSVRSYFG